jgi:opacity protein-like surface antigen
MRNAIMGAASALAFASPAAAADLPVPRYSEVPSYEYRTAPPVVVEEAAPVIVARPPVVVEEYPIYAVPPVYAPPPVYAYAGPVWREGWGHRGHFRGRW